MFPVIPLITVLAFIFGCVIGSFLNVVSLRFKTGKGLNGRSMCMSCGKTLTWKELVPVFSFLVQKGKCHGCKSKISWQYPLVELATGTLFALIFWQTLKYATISPAVIAITLIYLISTCLLIVITVYDIRHKIIPDSLVYTFDTLALISVFVGGPIDDPRAASLDLASRSDTGLAVRFALAGLKRRLDGPWRRQTGLRAGLAPRLECRYQCGHSGLLDRRDHKLALDVRDLSPIQIPLGDPIRAVSDPWTLSSLVFPYPSPRFPHAGEPFLTHVGGRISMSAVY